ncbi:hypothetical protein [Microvirga sp. CF3016]|uniref:hypothetical protein n=1 Tax=Microvirga sp. CF3016 TaxID=3110181 RepID=UPI002E7A7486|nr:hypothetical protein [Microvirga sp. CF3016]MEE1612067.1 hypothetical protein [Microvirga sp. CF3016]
MKDHRRIAYQRIAASALSNAESIVKRWLPDGRREGAEWVARNPRRADRSLGSFKVNVRTGKWGDFSSGDRGGDLIALAAFIFSLNQAEAARNVADMLGVALYE